MDVGDRISILVTSFRCWCPTSMLKDRGCRWQNRPKLSPTSQSCRQHISSPTSVTNIDVAGKARSKMAIIGSSKKMFRDETALTEKVLGSFATTVPLGAVMIIFGLLSSTFRLWDQGFTNSGRIDSNIQTFFNFPTSWYVYPWYCIYLTLPGLFTGKGKLILCCILGRCVVNGPVTNIQTNYALVQESLSKFSKQDSNRSVLI